MSQGEHGSTLRFLPAVVIALGALPGDAEAQVIPSPYRFVETRHEGGLFAGGLSPSEGQFGLGPKAGATAGGRYSIAIGGPVALEGVATFLKSERDVLSPGLEGEPRKVGEARSDVLILDARLRFSILGQRTWRRVSPFVVAGAGLAFDVSGAQPADESVPADFRYSLGKPFAGVIGLGLRWFPGQRISVRGDLTLQIWTQKIPEGYRQFEDELAPVPESESIQAPGLSIGASYNF